MVNEGWRTEWLTVPAPAPAPPMSVTLEGFRIDKLEVELERSWYSDGWNVRTTMHVQPVSGTESGYAPCDCEQCKSKARTVPVHCSKAFDHAMLARMDKPARARLVKAEITRLLEHEVEEQLKIDGEYAFDPHGTRFHKPVPKPPVAKPIPKPKRATFPDLAARYTRGQRVTGKFPARDLVVPRGFNRWLAAQGARP